MSNLKHFPMVPNASMSGLEKFTDISDGKLNYNGNKLTDKCDIRAYSTQMICHTCGHVFEGLSPLDAGEIQCRNNLSQ